MPLTFRGFNHGIEIRWQVFTRATSRCGTVNGPHRYVKIENFHSVFGPEKVAGLDVPVRDAMLVQVRQTFRHLHAHLNRFGQAEFFSINQLPDFCPFHIVKNEVWIANRLE